MPRTAVHVLLVEDNPDDADLLQETLGEAGDGKFAVAQVETLAQALQYLERGGVDVVLLDLSLPDCHGLETVRRMLVRVPHIPIVVLTGLDDETFGMAALHAGAQDYLVKGQIDGRLLVRCLRYARERHRLVAEKTEDAQVWAALARVGQELISSISQHALHDRFCAVTVDVLHCDFAHTWMYDSSAPGYVPLAASSAEEWQRIRDLAMPSQTEEALMEALGSSPVLYGSSAEVLALLPARGVSGAEPVSAVLVMALGRGRDIVGIHYCGVRGEAIEFTSAQERIAQGLVHLASLALENARLLDELERANAVKTYFAATMSHELRSTVFAIAGHSELALKELSAQLRPEQCRALRLVNERAKESMRLIEATLELTRSESKRSALEERDLGIADLFGELAAEIVVPAEQSALQLQWHVERGAESLRTDPVKLKMVLENLVTNAIKFTREGSVHVTARGDPDAVRFTVADTGGGIPSGEISAIFEPFYQRSETVPSRGGGFGLGLYIVCRLVEMLGGEIQVESEVGRGSTFSFSLPAESGGARLSSENDEAEEIGQ